MTSNIDTGGLGNYWTPAADKIDQRIELLRGLAKARTKGRHFEPGKYACSCTEFSKLFTQQDGKEDVSFEDPEESDLVFASAAANSIMPVISEVERLKAELSKAQERIKELEEHNADRIRINEGRNE